MCSKATSFAKTKTKRRHRQLTYKENSQCWVTQHGPVSTQVQLMVSIEGYSANLLLCDAELDCLPSFVQSVGGQPFMYRVKI